MVLFGGMLLLASVVMAAPSIQAPADPAAALGRRALAFLAGRAADPDPEVRAAVAAAWGEIGNPAAKPLLEKAAADRNDYVRIEAAASLELLGARGAHVLEEIVSKSSATTGAHLSPAEEMRVLAHDKARVAAIRKLAGMGSERVVALLEKTLEDRSPSVRDATAVALCRLGFDEFSSRFLEALSDPDESVRSAAAKALGEIALPAAAEPLMRIAGEDSADVRAEVMRSLGALEDDIVVDTLVKGVQDDKARVRLMAAGGLARHASSSAAMPMLRRLAKDEKTPDLALKAMEGLARRGETVGLSLAERTLSGPDIDGRMIALDVIAAVRTDAALELLKGAMERDASPRVRVQAAALIVKRLQKGGAQ